MWADGTKVYAVNAGKTTSSKYYTSGSKTEPTDNTGLWVVQKVGDYYNIASAKADNLFTYLQDANSNYKQKQLFILMLVQLLDKLKLVKVRLNVTL